MKKRHSSTRKTMTCIAILTIFLLSGLGGIGWGVEWPKDVTAITPSPGASAHMVLVGIGRVVQKYTPIEHWIVQPLGGPLTWLPLMKAGRCQFANHSSSNIIDAFLGRGSYAKMGPQDVRTVLAGHDYMHTFWTTPNTGIRTVTDLKGKVVYVKTPGNPLNPNMVRAQFNCVGMTMKDLKSALAFASIKETTRDLIEGRVDALIYPVVPAFVMQINEAKGECVFVTLTKEQAECVVKRLEGYYVQDIPANDPRFRNKNAVPNAVCFQQAMYTPASMDPDIVYGVVKAILEHSDEFADCHPSAKYWSLKKKPVANAVPYHEAAIRYFKEKGLWTDEAQAHQDKMLKRQKAVLK